jgi:hypothetical protein
VLRVGVDSLSLGSTPDWTGQEGWRRRALLNSGRSRNGCKRTLRPIHRYGNRRLGIHRCDSSRAVASAGRSRRLRGEEAPRELFGLDYNLLRNNRVLRGPGALRARLGKSVIDGRARKRTRASSKADRDRMAPQSARTTSRTERAALLKAGEKLRVRTKPSANLRYPVRSLRPCQSFE